MAARLRTGQEPDIRPDIRHQATQPGTIQGPVGVERQSVGVLLATAGGKGEKGGKEGKGFRQPEAGPWRGGDLHGRRGDGEQSEGKPSDAETISAMLGVERLHQWT